MTTILERGNYLDSKHAADIGYLMNRYVPAIPRARGSPLTPEITSRLATELSKISHACSIICYVSGKPAGLINCFEAASTFECKPIVNVRDIVVVRRISRPEALAIFCYMKLKIWLWRKSAVRLR